MADLSLDRGLWGTWRSRGLTPTPLPSAWFKSAGGKPLYYRADHVDEWLAARRGEPFDRHDAWCAWLTANHLPADPAWARRLAERAGPVQGDVTFTVSGWREYLSSLSSAD